MKRLLEEYEKVLNKRVERGEIKTETYSGYLNDANRILEALVFATKEKDIQEAMIAYKHKGYYRNIIRDLKQIVQQRC